MESSGARLAGTFVGLALIATALAAVLVLAVDVFLLLFLAVLFAVFLYKTAQLLASRTPIGYGASLAAVVSVFLLTLVGSLALSGYRVTEQIDRAEKKIDESIGELRTRLSGQPRLRSLVRSLPYGEQLLSGDVESASREDTKSQQDSTLQTDRPQNRREAREQPRNSDKNTPPDNSDDSSGMTAGGSSSGQASSIAGRAFSLLGRMFATTFGFLTNLAVIFFVGLFVAVSPATYKAGVVRLFPLTRRERVAEIMDELGETLWRWLLGRFLSMLLTGAGTGLALWLLGIPLAWTMGAVTGALTFVPNIGAVISLALAVLLALPTGPMNAIWVIVAYLVLQLVESNVITPLVQQHQVSVPPALLIACQLLMGALTGFLGVMVATPLLAAGMVCVKRAYLEDILGEEPGDSSHSGG